VVAIDVNREYYELGRPVIEKAGVAHKVDFREAGPSGHMCHVCSSHRAPEFRGPQIFLMAYILMMGNKR
jgi:predicted O-methyltransferase YrrM